MSLSFFAVDFLYYGPVMLIDQFGFDFYVNGLIINFSELITYVVSFIFITGFKRRKINIILNSIALCCSFALVFLHKV